MTKFADDRPTRTLKLQYILDCATRCALVRERRSGGWWANGCSRSAG
jgi:hypothetical protein